MYAACIIAICGAKACICTSFYTINIKRKLKLREIIGYCIDMRQQ